MEYWQEVEKARKKFKNKEISKEEYTKLLKKAKDIPLVSFNLLLDLIRR